MRWTAMNKQLTRTLGGLILAAGFTGCSAFQTSHIAEPEPALSINALASADAAQTPQVFTLVAADSVGLATFGYDLALWDTRYHDDRFADGQ